MKTFIFDLYNTLIEVKTDEHCERAWAPVVEFFGAKRIKTDWKRLCFEFDRYWKLFNERAQAERQYQYPECDCITQFESIARSVGGRLGRDDAAKALCIMREASIEKLKLFDGTIELLDELHARGCKVYLLSNAQAVFTRKEIERVGLSDKFDGVCLSSDYGVRKPDPAFYEILFDEYDLDKSNAVMIGDDMDADVRGAERFGIRGLWAGGGAASHREEILELIK